MFRRFLLFFTPWGVLNRLYLFIPPPPDTLFCAQTVVASYCLPLSLYCSLYYRSSIAFESVLFRLLLFRCLAHCLIPSPDIHFSWSSRGTPSAAFFKGQRPPPPPSGTTPHHNGFPSGRVLIMRVNVDTKLSFFCSLLIYCSPL